MLLTSSDGVIPRDGGDGPTRRRPNVGYYERWVSSLLGGAFAAVGLRRRYYRSPRGIGLLLVAGHQIYRGITGQDRIFRLVGVDTSGSDEVTTPRSAGGTSVDQSRTINKPAEELYTFWRNFENLPRFMTHLESVSTLDERRSHWVAKAPAGTTVEWDAEIVEDLPNERIAWRSLPNADVDNHGTVRFKPAPGGRGTEVHVALTYRPPAGVIGTAVAKLFGEEPEQQIAGDLLRFKNLMEAGEIPTTGGQSHGERSALGKLFSPNA